MESKASDGMGHDTVTLDIDESADSYNLEWLFDSDRMDHLPIEEQLKMYRCRDLRQSKFFRFGIGLWETLPSRKRRLVAPPIVSADESNCDTSPCQLQMSNQRPTDATSSTKEGRTSAPVVMSAADLSAKESRTLAPCIKNEKMSSYRSWLQERQLLRKGLDNFVVLEDWLAGKAEKTDLERRVLQQIVEENYLKNLRPAPPNEEPVEENSLDILPTVRRPSPAAIRIIEKFLYDNQIRLIDLFQQVDKNKDWMITRSEFRAAIKQSGMPLSSSDVDELIVIFDERGTGRLDYRELAHCLKLWRQEKKDAKKHRQQEVLSKSNSVTDDDYRQLMGFELESDSGLRFTSRRQSPTVPTSCHTGPNTFLVIGTDPPPSRRRVAVSAPPQLETLPVGKLIPITVGTLDNLTNSTNNRQSSGRPLPSKTRTFHVSHSASETLRRRTWNTNSAVRRRADSYHHSLTNDSTPVEMNLLKPPPLDLRSEQLTLSPEEMADVKYRNRHLLRLHSANHWRAAKQQSDGERPKVAVIKSGDANIDNHCAPSTLTGDVADAIDAYRQQQLRVYTEACQLCRESGVVLSERLLRSVLLHPGDRPHASIKNNIRQPGELLSSAQFKKSEPSRGVLSSAVTRKSIASEDAGNSVSHDDSDDDASERHVSSALHLYRRKKPSSSSVMNLSTGKAKVAAKVDCWLTFDEYFELTRKLTSKPFNYIRHKPDENADWTLRLLDKLRLVLPPGGDCRGSGALFQPTNGGRSHCPGRYRTGLSAWPVNDAGYVQYGTIDK